MKSGILIANPAAGRKEKRQIVDAVIKEAESAGCKLRLMLTEYAGHATELASEAVSRGDSVVAVFGGDGTIREAGVALIHTGIPLYIIPAGTSNVLARSLGISLDPKRAALLFRNGSVADLDGAKVNGHPFFFMCGAGIDANVMDAAHIPAKKLLGRVSFYPAVLREIFTYSFTPINVTVDGTEYRGTYAAIMNIPHFAGPYLLCPPARYDDGKLDVVIFHGSRRRDYVKYFMRIKKKKLLDEPDITHVQGSKICLTAGKPMKYQIDGDCVGTLPIEVEVLPSALKVVR